MYEYNAQVVRVIDGDTVEIDIDLGFKMTYKKAHMRLSGMNAPEMNTSAGKSSKARLIELCEMKPKTVVQSKGFDKYGRVLGVIFVDTVNVNQQMVNEKFAVAV